MSQQFNIYSFEEKPDLNISFEINIYSYCAKNLQLNSTKVKVDCQNNLIPGQFIVLHNTNSTTLILCEVEIYTSI